VKRWSFFACLAAAALVAPSAVPAAAHAAQPATAARAAPAAGTFLVHAIDVGTGLAIFVEGHDFALLYDAGSNDDGARAPNDRVLAYLRAVRPDLAVINHLFLSHPHEDHDAMIDDVLAAYQVREVWNSGSFNPACAYHAFLDAVVAESGVIYHDALGSGGTHDATFPASTSRCHGAVRSATVRVPRGSQIAPGAPIPLGTNARMVILHANGNASAAHRNDASIVVRLDLGTRRILLMGDAEAENGRRNPPSTPPRADSVEGQLLARFQPELRSDVLVVGHHGSMTSSRATFLDAVGAGQFVISVGPTKYSGTTLPDATVITELGRRGTIWRTDLNDATCGSNPRKIGTDNDGKPGGCDNIRITIDGTGALTPAYNRISD
jgi:competence protein ComEC